MKYRAEIDGLRAVAIIPVVLFHAGFSLFSGGYVGVDVFFVISGYLITSIIVTGLESNTFTIRNFYIRRARRILPSLILVSVACLVASCLILTPYDLNRFFASLFSVVFFISNIQFYRESGYFDTDAEFKPLLHTWSLSIEEQFYVIFPVFLIFLWRFGGKARVLVPVILALASIAITQWLANTNPSAAFYLLPARAWELLAGMLSACYLHGNLPKSSPFSNVLGVVGLLLIGIAVFWFTEATPFPSLYTLLPTVGTVLVIVFGSGGTLVSTLLSNRQLVGIGLISYSTYLWHQPILVFARYLTLGEIQAPALLALVVVAFILGWLTWKYIEIPVRSRSTVSRWPTRKFLLYITTSLAFLAVIGLFGRYGYSDKLFTDQQLNTANSSARGNFSLCDDFDSWCINAPGNSNNVLLLGDSNAYHFESALSSVVASKGGQLADISYGGCLPLSPYSRLDEGPDFNNACAERNSLIREKIQTSPDLPRTVVVSAAWLLYYWGEGYYEDMVPDAMVKLSEIELSSDGRSAMDIREDNSFFDYIRETTNFLEVYFDRVILVGPIPPSLFSLKRRAYLFNGAPGSATRDFMHYADDLLALFEELDEKEKTTVIFPHLAICRQNEPALCEAFVDDKHLYSDPSHFSEYGSAVIMAPLFEALFPE